MDSVTLLHGDCLELMKSIPDKSVDMVLCDLPYGTTACKWDSVIPFESLWEQYKRIIKPNCAIVLFGQEPFSSALRMSNIKWFRYDWIWDKGRGHNFTQANFCPMRSHEIISVFSDAPTVYSNDGRKCRYNPQMWDSGKPYFVRERQRKSQTEMLSKNSSAAMVCPNTNSNGDRYPLSILRFGKDNKGYHPTQKPVALLEYLVKTYTNEGDTVMDNTMGSGSTGVACVNTNRNFIGIELNDEYFDIASSRIKKAEDEKAEILF